MLDARTGENTKAESEDGIIVFLIKLVNPKTKPIKAPFLGPQNREPIITGTCIIVALITTSGIYPRGVNAISTIMAENIAVRTNSRVF